MFVNLMKHSFPAILGASAVAPICSIIDIGIVKFHYSGDMIGSIIKSTNEFKIDNTSLLNFSIICSPLISTNFIKGHKKQIIVGTGICVFLSIIKDILILGKDVPMATKMMFVARDSIANCPSLLFPGGMFRKQFAAIVGCQIPCTILNSTAIDYHLFSCDKKKDKYMNKDTYNRIYNSFVNSYAVRVLRSFFSIGASTGINYNMKKIIY